jgi:GNAT superfamily N-acetyltransferase
MRSIIEALRLYMAQQHERFAHQWQVAEVRIITAADEDIGWMQTAPADDAVFLKQRYYLDERFQRRGIGSRVMWGLIEETRHAHMAITLGVGEINPARRLYERMGFRIAHEDQQGYRANAARTGALAGVTSRYFPRQ